MIHSKKILMAVAALALSTACAGAVIVDCPTAGDLKKIVRNYTLPELTITGHVNAADLYFLGDSLSALTSLDLSAAVIDAYDGVAIKLREHYDANLIPRMTFAGSSIEKVVLPTATKVTIDDGAFAASAIKDIDLTGVDSVGMGAFAACPSLTEVTLTTDCVGANAFADCNALTNVTLQGVTRLADGIFARCTSLATIDGSQEVSKIGNEAMLGCRSLTTYTFAKDLTAIGARAFEMSGLQSADLSNTALTTLGNRTFASCQALTVVRLGDNIADLGCGTFFDDKQLADIKLPASVTALPARVFKGAEAIGGDIVLADGIVGIGDFAMTGMSGVTTLTLPSTLEFVGNYAMEGMTSLTKIDVTTLTSVPQTGCEVWRGLDQPEITLRIMKETAADFEAADQWREFKFDIVSGVEDITDDATITPTVKARFEGFNLHVTAMGGDLQQVVLYDAAGHLLAAVAPHAADTVIDTGDFSDRLYIIVATLADGRNAGLKIVRL